ncbi:MAG: ribonuclease H-like domain-containing protein [Eubacteriales bacterium]|nr:ribonuclease H-like domain-containing protein [Eubacteriales bacterium]
MIKKTYTTHLNLENTPFQDCDPYGLLFFDIETTGFTARSSSLYLIGTVNFQGPDWVITQWFAQTPQEETEILHAFLSFAKQFSQIIHFNGERFDIPYIKEKSLTCQMPDIFSGLVSRDLFRMIRPLKPLLQLSSLNQKSLEEYLGLFRRDPYNGGELIKVYYDYSRTHSEDLLRVLLLHNYEDLLGMLSILPMLSYLPLLEGGFGILAAEEDEDTLIVRGCLPGPVPKSFSLREELFYLSCSESYFAMQISGTHQPLKHFFSDFKNYYYLPLEDTAIHKSVASFVDKQYREPAKASNCYCRRKGFYLPQYEALFTPVFKENYSDRLLYFSCKEEFTADKNALHKYVSHLLQTM